MVRDSRNVRGLSASLVLVAVLVILGSSIGTLDARESGHFSPAVNSPSNSAPAQGTRSVLLTGANSTVTAGVGIRFVLNASPVNCAHGVAANVSVSDIAIHLGDGFVFEELPQDIDTYAAGCSGYPWTISIPLEYSYRTPGTERVQAFVTWGDGVTVASNTLTVNVTSRAPANYGLMTLWFWGALTGVSATLIACYALRRRLPKSPSLPPTRV